MKLCVLFICALGLAVSVNANADESKEQNSTAPQVSQQAADTNKASSNQTVDEEASHQHDALKTQFLGKRPYMEIKAK